MPAADLIDAVIQDYDAVDPTDVDNSPLRAKYLRYLQQIYNYVWNIREWEWTYAETLINGNANQDYLALPETYLGMGQQGSLWNDSLRLRLYPKAKYFVERIRRENAQGSAVPIFGIWGGQIQLSYVMTTPTPFRLFHRILPETLTDDDTPFTIPNRWELVVLLPGLVWKSQTKKQDARPTWGQQFQAGLSQMAAAENPSQHELLRMPVAVRRGW